MERGTGHWIGRMSGAVVALALSGCGASLLVQPPEEDGGGSTGGPVPASTSTSGTSSTSSSTSTGGGDSGWDPGEGSTTGSNFIMEPDGGSVWECDFWEDECPMGEKCVPVALNGGGAWDSSRCVPIADEVVGYGEPCVPLGDAADNCADRMVCWDVDPETGKGMCMEMCSNAANPTCETVGTSCNVFKEGPSLCMAHCMPTEAGTCPVGCGCYYTGQEFWCVSDASGDEGQHGDPCDFANTCDPGSQCVNPQLVPDCQGSIGCCSPNCLVSLAEVCPGAAGGEECVPWYEEGTAPPGYEDVGVCVIPL